MASSVAMTRVGGPTDLYYVSPESHNSKVQSIPVEYNTRFTQDFSNKSGGTSVFIIPPGNGLRHVVIVLGWSAASLGASNVFALERGWGYRVLEQVSFRIAGSSQYFMTGKQLLLRNLTLCRTQSQRDAMLSLGGNECKTPADFSVDQFAYIPVPVWCMPSADGIALPLPGDLLSQQVQITATIAPKASYVINDDGSFPNALDTAYFQVEQLVMNDKAMALANRVDMNTHSYSMPMLFDQQELQINLQATATSQPVVLTGFRAGECKEVLIYLTKDSEQAANALKWYAPKQVQALYAGTIFAQYDSGSSQIWNLLDGTAPAAVNQSQIAGVPGAYTSTAVLSQWAELPFGQPTGNDYDAEVLTHGKNITNGIVNLQITTPTADAYTLHVIYRYNSAISFAKGSADILF